MKRNLAWYMDKSKENHNLKSDRKLAQELKISGVGHWRDPYRHMIPEIHVMLRLAKLAGISDETAVIDREIWEATYKAPDTVPIYENIKKALKLLSKTAAVLLVLTTITLVSAALQPAHAGERESSVAHLIYIMECF